MIAAAPGLAGSRVSAANPIQALEHRVGGRIGVIAADLGTGRTLAWRAHERFLMCSTFKASLAGLVLSRVDQGRERLDRRVPLRAADVPDWWAPVARANLARGEMTIAELCAAAVEQSDNSCANLLLAAVGGPPAMTAFWRRLGDPVTRLDDTEPLLNRTPAGDPRNRTTPAAMASDVRALALGPALMPGSRARLIAWMLACKTGLGRLRAGLPAGWRIGDKTGSNDAGAGGDLAIAWPRAAAPPIVIAAYVEDVRRNGAAFDAVFAAIGRMLVQL